MSYITNNVYSADTMSEECYEATYVRPYYDEDMVTGDFVDSYAEPANAMQVIMAAESTVAIDDLEPELAEYLS